MNKQLKKKTNYHQNTPEILNAVFKSSNKMLHASFLPVCLFVDGRNHVQHGEARVPAAGQSPPSEHFRGPTGLQLQAGRGPSSFWERGLPGFRAPPQRTGLSWRGK